ncbi:hypothetical protein B0H16DRAFT_41478 [Mycena metata]|uniref:Uncharacterized protein n=1 Tax=Mycena metata TaxID=1033252 RepID=A0AAD7NU52_9AGAR|nr:hypothetical protein B0H16DRAFT_41478 [Mycena metata]
MRRCWMRRRRRARGCYWKWAWLGSNADPTINDSVPGAGTLRLCRSPAASPTCALHYRTRVRPVPASSSARPYALSSPDFSELGPGGRGRRSARVEGRRTKTTSSNKHLLIDCPPVRQITIFLSRKVLVNNVFLLYHGQSESTIKVPPQFSAGYYHSHYDPTASILRFNTRSPRLIPASGVKITTRTTLIILADFCL